VERVVLNALAKGTAALPPNICAFGDLLPSFSEKPIHLFERFAQVERSPRRLHNGLANSNLSFARLIYLFAPSAIVLRSVRAGTGILCPSHFQLVEVAVVTTKPGNDLVTFEQLKISWRLHERDDK
jgi:hypothetical protein